VWILATVLGVFVFFILLLSIPVHLAFHVYRDEAFHSRVRVGWMFNLVGKDVKRKKKTEKEKPKGRKRKRRIKPFVAMIRSTGFLRRLLRFVRDIFRISHVRDFEIDLRIGLNDPAETGMLFAAIAPALVQFRTFTPFDIQILPDFEQAVLQGYVKSDLRIFPIQFIFTGMLFVLSPATIRALLSMVLAWRR
jgi:hypothetical protein